MLNFVLPALTVNFEVPALMAVRVVQGALQGIIIPAMFSLTAKWTPKPEKNRMMAFMISGSIVMELLCLVGTTKIFLAGIQVGLILTPPITSVVTDTFGWETCFYLVGSTTCIWFAFWAYFVYNSPEEHPRISKVTERMIFVG